MYVLRITTKTTGHWLLEQVVEFISGKNYFFIRLTDGKTISVDRGSIIKVDRKTEKGFFKEVRLRKS